MTRRVRRDFSHHGVVKDTGSQAHQVTPRAHRFLKGMNRVGEMVGPPFTGEQPRGNPPKPAAKNVLAPSASSLPRAGFSVFIRACD